MSVLLQGQILLNSPVNGLYALFLYVLCNSFLKTGHTDFYDMVTLESRFFTHDLILLLGVTCLLSGFLYSFFFFKCAFFVTLFSKVCFCSLCSTSVLAKTLLEY